MFSMTKQIMVVDDDVELLTLLGIILERGGFSVLRAEGALAALDMLKESTPDLFILDLMLPDMDGFELCRQIRTYPQTAQTPVLILSARNDFESIEGGFEAGANGYLSKPVKRQDLVAQVYSMLVLDREGASPLSGRPE
jgi:DNA-binding response OmpR family regulator